jgi:uncharacterized protein YceH (UPF0502 family)
LLAVLMLRGAQTPGELKQRSDRLHSFAGLGAVLETLEGLVERELVARHPRRPGQKEERYEQLLGGSGKLPAGSAESDRPSLPSDAAEDRFDRLERELAELREELEKLRDALGG